MNNEPQVFAEMKIVAPIEVVLLLLGASAGAISFIWTGLSLSSVIICLLSTILGALLAVFFTSIRLISYMVRYFEYAEIVNKPLMRTLTALMGGKNRLEVR